MAILGAGGGGSAISYEPTTNNQVLEAGKKYILTEGVNVVKLPATSGLPKGSTVTIRNATNSLNGAVVVNAPLKEFIVYDGKLRGQNAVSITGSSSTSLSFPFVRDTTQEVTLTWNGIWWEDYPIVSGFDAYLSTVKTKLEAAETTNTTTSIQYNSNEDTFFIVPNNATGQICVTVWGAGGASGNYTGGNPYGGSSGAVIYKEYIDVSVGDVFAIKTGAPNTNTNEGGASYFGGDLLIAYGGKNASGGYGTYAGSITPQYAYNGTNQGGSVTNTATGVTYTTSNYDGTSRGGGASALANGGSALGPGSFSASGGSLGSGGGCGYAAVGGGGSGGIHITWGSALGTGF